VLLMVMVFLTVGSLLLSLWTAFTARRQLCVVDRDFQWLYSCYSALVLYQLNCRGLSAVSSLDMDHCSSVGFGLVIVIVVDVLLFAHLSLFQLAQLEWKSSGRPKCLSVVLIPLALVNRKSLAGDVILRALRRHTDENCFDSPFRASL